MAVATSRACFYGVVVAVGLFLLILVAFEKSYFISSQPLSTPAATWAIDKESQIKKSICVEPIVLSLSYSEQAANAEKNLMDLQCWAKMVNISKVVEPSVSVKNGIFRTFTDSKTSLKFGDLFNIAHWNKVSDEYNFSPLGPLEYFWEHAVKDLVYVHIKHTAGNCKTKKELYKLLTGKGFRIVKTVCIDFVASPVMSEESFQEKIFNGVGHNVTVVFNVWRGIRTSGRIALSGNKCSDRLTKMAKLKLSAKTASSAISYVPLKSISPLAPSQRIRQFVDHFVSKYLSGAKYTAVMLRTEKLNETIISQPPRNNSCINLILSDRKKLEEQMNISRTLFFCDSGKYGSSTWNNLHARNFSWYVQDALHLKLRLYKLNSILEGLTHSQHSMQMAILHQQLVARATCVVLVGGGSFQSQTRHMYASLHKGQECYVFRDHQCERLYIERVIGQYLA